MDLGLFQGLRFNGLGSRFEGIGLRVKTIIVWSSAKV